MWEGIRKAGGMTLIYVDLKGNMKYNYDNCRKSKDLVEKRLETGAESCPRHLCSPETSELGVGTGKSQKSLKTNIEIS